MATFKNPSRNVWHTSVCSRCSKVITRVKLPGLFKTTSHRICDACLSEDGAAQGAALAAVAGIGGAAAPPSATRAPAPARRPGGGGGGARRAPAAKPAAE